MTQEREMLVSKIDTGTVIDKIPGGLSITILRVLNIREDVTDTVAVAIRVKSTSLGVKDIIKMTNRFLTEDDFQKIWLISPEAVVSTIHDYKVSEKFVLSDKITSDEIVGVLKCENPSCATNFNEPVSGRFTLMRRDPMLIRCKYCDRVMLESNITDQF